MTVQWIFRVLVGERESFFRRYFESVRPGQKLTPGVMGSLRKGHVAVVTVVGKGS